MTVRYVDLEGGNDTTGDGSYTTPYKTHNKAFFASADGDEIRVAKNTTADTVITTPVTWTRNSLLVSISGDQTATMTAASYIGKPTAAGNGAFETFYRVASSAYSATTGLTTVTLSLKYIGTTDTTASLTKKFIAVDTGNDAAYTTSTCSFYKGGVYRGLTVSGGWNLATQTRDGETWCMANPQNITTAWNFFHEPGAGGKTSSITYMNIVETSLTYNFPAVEVGLKTIRYVTAYQNVAWASNCMAREITDHICYSSLGAGAINQWTNGTITFTLSDAQLNSNGTYWFNYSATSMTLNNCILASSIDVFTLHTTVRPTTLNNTKIIGTLATSTYGINMPIANQYLLFTGTSSVEYCVVGIYNSSTTSTGVVIENPVVNYCTTGIHSGSQKWGSIIYNYTSDNCSYCFNDGDIHSRNNVVRGYTFTNTLTYAFNIGSGNTTTNLVGGVVDSATAAKLIYTPTTNTFLPKYTISQMTNATNGIYWATYKFMFYNNVYRATPPSYWFSTSTTLSTNYLYTKIWSGYVLAGDSYKVSVWIKTGGPSWIGTLKMCLTLDSLRLVSTSTTTVSDVWTKYEFTTPTDITTDGELALEVNINQNIIDLFFDDFDIVVV